MFELSSSQFIKNNVLVIPSYIVGRVLGRIYLPTRSQWGALESRGCYMFSETNCCNVKLVHTCKSRPKSLHKPSGKVAERLNIFHLDDIRCGFVDLQLLEIWYIWIKSTI